MKYATIKAIGEMLEARFNEANSKRSAAWEAVCEFENQHNLSCWDKDQQERVPEHLRDEYMKLVKDCNEATEASDNEFEVFKDFFEHNWH